jgi:hypothetical protein
MSEYKAYIEEKEKIDGLIQEGYRIICVNEDLDGAFVEFERLEDKSRRQLQILTADARKYFSNILMTE